MNFDNNPFMKNNNNAFGANQNPFDVNPFGSQPTFNEGPRFDMSARGHSVRAGEFHLGAIKSVRVTSCNFTEMVEQAPVGFRPFVNKVNDSQVLDMLPDFVRNQRHGANFRAETFNPIVNDIIGLSANSMGNVPIVNGWSIRRYSFTIMAEVERSTGQTQNYMIEGFTDTPEIMARANEIFIDPTMVLYVNNVVSFGQRMNMNTRATTLVPVENYGVINRDSFDQAAPLHTLVTQRPYDVVNMCASGLLSGNSGQVVVDTRSNVATESKTNALENNNPATYLTKIINNGITSIENSNTDSVFNTTTFKNMLNSVNEPTLSKNGFLQQLGRASNGSTGSVTSFTWRELVSVDPSLGNPSCPYLNLFPATNRDIFLPSNGLQCDDINGSGNEQVFATMIANGIVDLMARCRAVQVSVLASNDKGFDEVNVVAMKCYDEADIPIQAPLFEQMFRANVLQMVNQNTNFAYNVAVSSTVWGETFVKINLGYGTYSFLFPNFANSMYSPVLTNHKVGTEDLSRHLLSLVNTINNEQSVNVNNFSGSIL